MPEFVTGMGRIVVPYVISGLVHKFRLFCKQPTVGGTTYQIWSRTATGPNLDWEPVAEDMAAMLSNVLPGGTTPQAAYLEKWTGTVWQLLEVHTVTLPNLSGAEAPGWQFTAVFRDTGNEKLKAVIMEPPYSNAFHWTTLLGGAAIFDAFLKEWNETTKTLTYPPWNWATSHRQVFVHGTSPFVGGTTTLNRKVRRARGLA